MSKIKYVGETALNALVAKIKSITGTVTGVMRFVGSLKELPKDNTSYNKGDVILVGTKEYVLNETDGNKVWVEIGDEGLWLSENDIIPYDGEPEKLIDNKNHIYMFSIGGIDIYFDADLSELASKRSVEDQLTSINRNIKSYINENYISRTFTSTRKVIYKFDNTNGYNINNTIIEIGGIKSEITIDLSDVYKQIEGIKTNNINKQDVYDILTKGSYYCLPNTITNKTIKLNLKAPTVFASTLGDDQYEDVELDTKKFVEDLKTEFINTGFVHDDSNTKTTFEEITYEEVENLFK